MARFAIVALALGLGLVAADAAAAATLGASYHRFSSHMRGPGAHMRHSVRSSRRRIRRIRLSAPRVGAAAVATPTELVRADDGDTSRSGWFKSRRQAGWGVSDGGAQTMVGFYQRPARPDIPGPQMYHEGQGAAGLSLSLKLGR